MSRNCVLYSDEFKKQIVDLYNSGQPTLELSLEYGVTTATIYNWVKQYSPVKVTEDKEITAKEYKAMQKRIAELESDVASDSVLDVSKIIVHKIKLNTLIFFKKSLLLF